MLIYTDHPFLKFIHIWFLLYSLDFLSIKNESLRYPQCEKLDLGVITPRAWKSKVCAGAGGFIWRAEGGETAPDKQGNIIFCESVVINVSCGLDVKSGYANFYDLSTF